MKNVLITGGSRGIGKSLVEKFADEGYNVLLNYNKSEINAKEISDKYPNVYPFKADVSNREEVQSMHEYFKSTLGNIDILINNAGVSNTSLFQDVTMDEWNQIISVNLTGVFNVTQVFLPDMLSRKEGKIINISSIWGMTGAAMEVIYSTSKAGVIGLTKALAKELGPSNINVNCIAPGPIMTDMISNYSIEEFDKITTEIPLNRIGSTEDVANLAFFLAVNESSYITGQVISPNGRMGNIKALLKKLE